MEVGNKVLNGVNALDDVPATSVLIDPAKIFFHILIFKVLHEKKRIPFAPQINILPVNIRRLEGNTISETHKSHIHNQSNLVHVTKQCRTHSGFSQYTIKTIALKR